jgi:hypothetical protein
VVADLSRTVRSLADCIVPQVPPYSRGY